MNPRLSIVLSYLGLVLLTTACQRQESPPEAPRTVMVTHPVLNQSSVNSYAGEVRSREESVLSFRVPGKISQRLVNVGDRVTANQPLARLDATDADLNLNAAKAQLESAKSAASTAKTELDRYQQLVGSNAVSRSQYDQIANQYKNAQAALQQAQSSYEVARNQSDYSLLTANKSGVIVARQIEVGQVVAAGQAAYTLAIDGEREVLIGIPEQLISQFKERQAVKVSMWSDPNRLWPAYVREISPAADASRTYAVRVSFEDPHAPVKIGQSARVFVSNTAAPDELQVPLSSVSAEQSRSFVWVLDGKSSSLQRRFVSIGIYGRDSVPVLSGLNRDDWVVVGGVHMLHEGQKVSPVDRDNRPVTAAPATAATPAKAAS